MIEVRPRPQKGTLHELITPDRIAGQMQRKCSQVRQKDGKLVAHVLRAATGAGFLNEREVLDVREWMDVTEPFLLASCRPTVICRFGSRRAVSASGLGHGRAPPWLQLHHTPTVARQPANSGKTVEPAGALTLCGGTRTILLPSPALEAVMA